MTFIVIVDDNPKLLQLFKSAAPPNWRIIQFDTLQKTAAIHVLATNITWFTVCPSVIDFIQSASRYTRVCVWSGVARFDVSTRDRCIQAGAWHVELDSIENLVRYMVAEMRGRVEVMLRLEPGVDSVCAQQLNTFWRTSRQRFGINGAHTYSPHCSLTGFVLCSRDAMEGIADVISNFVSAPELVPRRPTGFAVKTSGAENQYVLLTLEAPWCKTLVQGLVEARAQILSRAETAAASRDNAVDPRFVSVTPNPKSTRRRCTTEWSMGICDDDHTPQAAAHSKSDDAEQRDPLLIRPKPANHVSLAYAFHPDFAQAILQMATDAIQTQVAATSAWDIVLVERVVDPLVTKEQHLVIEHRRWPLCIDRAEEEKRTQQHIAARSPPKKMSVPVSPKSPLTPLRTLSKDLAPMPVPSLPSMPTGIADSSTATADALPEAIPVVQPVQVAVRQEAPSVPVEQVIRSIPVRPQERIPADGAVVAEPPSSKCCSVM